MANALPPPSSADDFDDLSSLGKYKIQRKVGSGGMGSVFLAIDQQLKRTVALKVLPKDKAANQTLVRRFKAEGQAGAQMEHPNIVSVYESGEIDGYLYLAMEFVEGIDAFELLRKRGVIPVKRSLDIIKQVVLALQHANQRQIVHRDIKPSNLMIRDRDGVVKLADLGLARFLEEDGDLGLTRAGTTVGTVDYMSPEQARDSKAADIRSDLYSLGCTWYHLLTGSPPYPEGDLMNKLRAHAMQPVPDPRQKNGNVPAGVAAIVQRMMAKKPEDRYQTPGQLLMDLNLPTLMRGDLSIDKLQLLGAEHASDQLSDSQDDQDAQQRSGTRRRPVTSSPSRGDRQSEPEPEAEEEEAPLRPGSRRNPKMLKPSREVDSAPPGASRAADKHAEEDNDSDGLPSPARKSGLPQKGKTTLSRENLPARSARVTAPPETDVGKRSKTERVLPSRIDKPAPADRPTRAVNPNLIKLGVLGIVIAAALYGGFFLLNRLGGAPSDDSGVVNPYGNREKNSVLTPSPVVESKPTPDAPAATSAAPTVVATPSPGSDQSNSVPSTSIAPLAGLEVDRSPFGGTVPFTEDGTAQVPRWVWQSRGRYMTVKPRVIRRGSPREGEFRDLALAKADLSGNVVFEFADEGPHEIAAFELQGAQNWTFRAAEGVAPVLILRSADLPIQLSGGILMMDGLHLVVLPDHPAPAIQLGAATLIARRSSFTHLAPQGSGLIVAEQGGRILLENSVVRGLGSCHSVTLKGPNTSLVAGQSLFVAGNASTIQLDSSDAKSDSRLVTLVSSACLSGQAAIACQHQGPQLPQLDLSLVASILAYLPGHSADAIGVSFTGWPASAESLDRPRAASVKWAAEKSCFVGWPHWAQLSFADGTGPVDVRDEEAWRAFWRQASPTGTLLPVGADLQSIASQGVLATGDDVQHGLSGIRAELGEAGPKWAELPSPPNGVLANVVAFGQSATIPTTLESPDPGATVEYDLKKAALGKFINSDQCPDGSTVVAFGFGLRSIDPFVVRQKRVQIVFKQTEGAALKLQPGNNPDGDRPAAWFAVEDGQLTLTNGSFLLQASKVRSYPERFLKMSGGLVAVRNCRVEGSDPSLPLLDTAASEGHAPPQLLIEKSLVVGPGSLVRVGAAETLIDIRGSALSSGAGDAVTVDIAANGSVVSVNRSTLSGARSVFHVLPMAASGASSLFARESVFRGGAVVQLEGEAAALQWWGLENAYASGMTKFLSSPTAAATQDFARDWVNTWGSGHELLSIFGENSTVMPDPPANLSEIVPQSFALNETCAAALAGPGGSGVGVQVPQLGPTLQVPAKAAPSKKGTGNPRPASPNF